MFALHEPTHAEQLGLFDSSRWPRRPYCSDDLESGLRIRSLKQAITKPYIQANPPHLRVWSIHDVDKPYADPEAGHLGGSAVLAWEEANLPPPSWAAVNRENGHAHLVWGLSAPVLVDGLGARDAPLRYLCAIEALFRALLGADPGFSGLITKNPAHPLWRTLRGPSAFYELWELADALPNIEKFVPKRGRVEEVGLGRNVVLFDQLRKWAYKGIRAYWGGGLSGWNAWLSQCNTKALVYNGDFLRPLDGREVWHIARSVAKWTWRTFSAEGFSQWQAAQGRKGGHASGQARKAASEDKRASARIMAAAGMSQRAIAQELGVSHVAVGKWLKEGGN